MGKKGWISFLLAFLTIGSPLKAEVQEIVITWNAFKCQNSCIAQIEQHFQAIKEVSNFRMQPSIGEASMNWDPNQTFSYEPFKYAAAAVGIYIRSIRVQVKGTIMQNGNDFYLISSGDNTRFLLIGPVHSEPGRYTPSYSLATRPLTDQMRETFLDLETRKAPVLISGPLYLPNQYALRLIVERINLNVDNKS